MDHSYFTERDRLQKTDHCYFTIAKKTPKVVLRRAQLLKEQQDTMRSPIGQDHSYVRSDHVSHMASSDDFLQLSGLSESLVSLSEGLTRSNVKFTGGDKDSSSQHISSFSGADPDITIKSEPTDCSTRDMMMSSQTGSHTVCTRNVMMSSEDVPNISQSCPVISLHDISSRQTTMSSQTGSHTLCTRQAMMSSVDELCDSSTSEESLVEACDDVDRMLNGVELDHAYDATIDVAIPTSTFTSRRQPWSFSDDFRITGRRPWSFTTGQRPWSFSDDSRITGRKPWSFSDDSRITGRSADIVTSVDDEIVSYESCSRLDDHTYHGSLVSPTA